MDTRYLDFGQRKEEDDEENCIMKSFVVFTKKKTQRWAVYVVLMPETRNAIF